LIAALALVGLAMAPSAALAQAAKVDDGTLKTRIEARLKSSASLKNDTINVSVDNGVATLTGTVHSAAQKVNAGRLAKIAGVTNVENKLDVDSASERAIDKAGEGTKKAAVKTKDATVKAGEKTKEVAVKVGEKTKDAAVAVGEAVTDAWITTKLKADFVNEDTLKGSNINVDTNNHVVTLKGTVASAAGRTRAAEIAKTTKGVQSVVNTLTIAPK
jgi:Predicted periplasmic or secreted lipoprotein